jgi:hypothetical protein
MTTRLFSVVVDCADPRGLGHWWSGALGWPIIYEEDDEVVVVPPDLAGPEADAPEGEMGGGVPGLVFGASTDPKRGKNRVHLDLASRSGEEQDAIVARLVAAGAAPVDIGQGDEVPWVVLADPEGNEFCVLDARDRYLGSNGVAAVVVDAHDPRALAAFWAEATGRTVAQSDDGMVTLRHPQGVLPDLEFLRTEDPRLGKNRLHLDVAPGIHDDRDAEVARLVALGATPTDVGQGPDVTWVVLADPEGNEFCVLRSR